MRSIAVHLALLLTLAAPLPALAGTFTVPFGNGVSMGAAGWSTKADAGALCGYEGDGTLFLNAGTLPAHSGCFYLFNAPGAAQIVSLATTLGYAKASTATALCAYSFAAVAGDTLRHCAGGTYTSAISAVGASWAELGIYNEGTSAIALATARANNVVFANGVVTLSDPTAPGLAANGPSGIQTGLSAQIQWEAFDPESGAPSIAYSLDGGPRIALRGGSCSWLCGAGASGSAAIDLSALADGTHSVTVFAQSYADAQASIGPLAFTVDRNAPGQPQIAVAPDSRAAAAGWWGHGPIALSVTTATTADVATSRLRVYDPSGATVLDETSVGALPSASVPASVLARDGAYQLDVVQCDPAGHCTTSPRTGLHWDGSAPPAGDDATAVPLGLIAARDGAHLTWPGITAALGGSGLAGGYAGIGATPGAARAAAFAATAVSAGAPGVGETAIPADAIHGGTQVCLAVRPLSGAGIAATGAAVRCAAVDEQPPALAVDGAVQWSSGPQTLALSSSDASGAVVSQVLVDGASVPVGATVTIAGEGVHAVRVVAHDGAGNETVADRTLGIDTTAPAIGAVHADFIAREIGVDLADARSGVAHASVSLGGTSLETRISADGGEAVARVPAGLELDGAAVSVRVADAAGNAAQLTTALPARTLPAFARLRVARGVVSGRVVAGAASQVSVWAYPKGREPHLLGTYATGAGGTFAVHVRPARTTRYSVAVPATQRLRALGEHAAGLLRVTARIRALTIRARGDRLVVRARFEGRGEATRLHLLVNDVLGGRWVEGCLVHGRPGVHLEPSGRVWGACPIPPSARGRAWTYRLVLAAPSSTWPWRTPSSARVSLLLPFAGSA